MNGDATRRAAYYRDGLGALAAPLAERLRRVEERAAELDPAARAELPPEHRRALDDGAERLARAPASAAELADFEAALEAYEQRVEDGLWLTTELRARRAAARRQRALALEVAFVVFGLIAVTAFSIRAHRRWTAARACRASAACRYEGLCGAAPEHGNRCVALERADCAAAPGCADLGLCSPGYDRCYPRTDDDCRPSKVCIEKGLCRTNWDPSAKPPSQARCVASEEGCRASVACSRDGKCRSLYGRCVALGE